MNKISFEFCDFNNQDHVLALIELLNHYMSDPMGDHAPLDPVQQLHLVDGLSNLQGAFVVFILVNGNYAGMSTCFELFSTFKAKYYMNIHDVVVDKQFRGQGIGRKLLEYLIQLAKDRKYCKITLEVREDNTAAKALYQSLEFHDCDPLMYFWTKTL